MKKHRSGDRVIRLTVEQYADLKRALQWPEDLAKFDRIAKPTSLTEIGLGYHTKTASKP